MAWTTDWPASFWITALSTLVYGLSCLPGGRRLLPGASHEPVVPIEG